MNKTTNHEDAPTAAVMKKITSHAIAAVVGGLIVAAGCVYFNFRQSLSSVLTQPAPEVAGVATKTLECKKVTHFDDKVKDRLGLPETVKKDADKHVTASTKVDASDRPTTVTSVYDTGTGVTDMYKRQDRLPWLDTRQKFGAGYSPFVFGSEHDKATQAFDVYWQPIKMKWVDLRLAAEATADGQWTGRARFGVTW